MPLAAPRPCSQKLVWGHRLARDSACEFLFFPFASCERRSLLPASVASLQLVIPNPFTRYTPTPTPEQAQIDDFKQRFAGKQSERGQAKEDGMAYYSLAA